MSLIVRVDETVPRLNKRTRCQWWVTDWNTLLRDTVVLSDAFLAGRSIWKLGLSYDPRSGRIKRFLMSCNAYFVTLDAAFCQTGQDPTCEDYERRTACPFEIAKTYGRQEANDSENDFLPNGVKSGQIDLKNVREATDEEKQYCENKMMRVILEIINRSSMEQASNGNDLGKVVSADKKRDAEVHGCSIMREWNEHNPDHRHWLVDLNANREILNMQCLSNFNPLDTFAGRCKKTTDAIPTMTFFREEKKPNQNFQPVDENTIVLFYKQREPPYKDSSFGGYLLLSKTMRFPDLLSKLADKAKIHNGEFKAFLKGPRAEKDITSEQRTLNECGIHSGSCVILQNLAQDRNIASSADQQALVGQHIEQRLDLDGSQNLSDLSLRMRPQPSASPNRQTPHRFGVFSAVLIFMISSRFEHRGRQEASAILTVGKLSLHLIVSLRSSSEMMDQPARVQ